MRSDRSPGAALAAAGPDRRLWAFALDQLLGWLLVAAGAAAVVVPLAPDRTAVGAAVTLAAIVAVALPVGLAFALLLGLRGTSPGKAVTGLRVVDVEDGVPIGVGRALGRTVAVGACTLPALGIGVAALAGTAMADPSGRRRGWHDRRARSVVVDARAGRAAPADPVAEADRETGPATGGLVNLTALRLAPPPAPGPAVAAPRVRVRPPTPARSTRWRVGFDTGETFVVGGLTLVGRDPEGGPGESVHRVVPLRSGDRSLSKTHVQFQVVPGGALVLMDRGSSNGSVLVRQGVSRRLAAHRPTTLLAGDVVRVGDRTMTVDREEHPEALVRDENLF